MKTKSKIWSFIRLCLPVLATLLFLMGCFFAYIAFDDFADNGMNAEISLPSLMASSFLFVGILVYRFFPFPKITIFSFKHSKNENVPILQYSVLFIVAHFVFSTIFNITTDWLGHEARPTFFKAIIPSAFVVAYLFIIKYNRVMTKIERRQIIIGNLVISLIISLGLYVLVAFDELENVSAKTLLVIIALVIVVTYWLQHITYGWLSKILLKNMKKKKSTGKNIVRDNSSA